DLLDLLDLHRLQRRGAADDRQVDAPVFFHLVDRVLEETGFADHRADAVLLDQAGIEPVHTRGGRGADANLFIFAIGKFFHAGRGVQADGAGQIRRRRDAFVENADLRGVPDAEDVTVDVDGIFELEVSDVGLGQGS